jgi:glucosamine--fructose-6-phosphate aminotransferase (isomerizing)
MAEKAGYKHFMLKEIFEQPDAARETILGRVSVDAGLVRLDEIGISDDEIRAFERVTIIACGTSWHAGLVGKFLIEELAGLPVEVDYGSEYRYRNPIVGRNTLAIVITQSGETADTLAALREARRKGARSLAICNVVGSMATREADGTLYTRAGPEIGVASTKAAGRDIEVRSGGGRPGGPLPYVRRLPVPRARHQLSDRARGRPEAQRDFVHPCRGLSGRRDETRAHRPDR